MGRARKHPYDGHFDWFGNSFDGRIFTNPNSLESWKIVRKINERCGKPDDIDNEVWEAVGVFICELVVSESSTDPKSQRILKVRMQIPTVRNTEDLSADHSVYASAATDRWSVAAHDEHKALLKLTAAGCRVTPRLDHFFVSTQKSDLWVPGGFLLACLMEKLPGVNLGNYWDVHTLPLNERDAIRAAFCRSLEEVYTLGFNPIDTHRSNILWDKEHNICFLIDLEYFWTITEETHVCRWRDFANWDLEYPGEMEARIEETEKDS